MLTVKSRVRPSLGDEDGGAAYVEFLIAFVPFFFMFLGMVQIALYYAAALSVRHAATTAARAAVVVLPDDPQYYDDEEVNRIDSGGGGGGGGGSILELGGVSMPGNDSSRLQAIRNAASIPLLPISPSFDQLVHDKSVARAIGDPESRALTGATIYNRAAVAVTFPTRPGASEYRDTFELRENVTVRVTYLFHCGVPVVSRLFCDDYLSLRTGLPSGAARDLIDAILSGDTDRVVAAEHHLRRATERLDRESVGVDELGEAETPMAAIVYAAFGARFRILRAEATMTNQGAGFVYGGS